MTPSPFIWFGLFILAMILIFLIPSILRQSEFNQELEQLGLVPLEDSQFLDERLNALISGTYTRNSRSLERSGYTLVSFQLMEHVRGDTDIQHGQFMAVISPRLDLPRFTLQSPIPQLVTGLVNRLDEQKLSMTPQANLGNAYRVYTNEQIEQVLTDRVKTALIDEALVSTLHAGGDTLAFAISRGNSYTKPGRKITAEELPGLLMSQADFLFTLFRGD